MSLAASRALLRRSTFAVRRAGVRNASSTSEAAGAAKEKAGEASSKASEGLTRVTSSAGSALSKAGDAAKGVADAAGRMGGRTGRLVGAVQSMIPRAIYYSRVSLELGKLIAHQRSMAPPSMQTMQSYFQPVVNAARNPGSLFSSSVSSGAVQPQNMLNQVRNMSSTQWLSLGVVAAEVVGFFTVGEMIGRFKLVGYRSSSAEHH